jgi:chromosome segregation ATPase
MCGIKALFYSLAVMCLVGSACSHQPKYKVNEQIVADLPLDEKQGLMAAQTERAQALQELEKARADITTDEHDIAKAEADLEQARLGVKKVEEDLKLATARQEIAAIQQLQDQLQVAKAAESAARQLLALYKQRRVLHQAQVDVANAHLQLADARYEQEKARLAARAGRRPSPKYPLSVYDQQVAMAQQRYEEALRAAARQEELARAMEENYNRALAQYSALRSRVPDFNPEYTPPGYLANPQPPGTNVGSRPPNQL